MSSPVHDYCKLVLAGLIEFVPDCVKTSLRICKTMLEEGLEFLLLNRHSDAVLNFSLILLSAI